VSQTDQALEDALTKSLRAIKAEAGGDEEPELRDLLLESKGTLIVDEEPTPFYRYAYAAADYLYSDPDRIVKAKDGITFVQLIDAVIALLRRQVRLDAASGATIPEALSASALLTEVLEASGKAPTPLKTADLQAI
jgi:hypothetical protein